MNGTRAMRRMRAGQRWGAMLAGLALVAGAGAQPTNAAQSDGAPRLTDLACATNFWLAGLVWPQEREGWLSYANGAIAKHLAATPQGNRAQIEAQVMADGQARAQRLQRGGTEPEAFKSDLTVCARQFGIQSNTATPAAAPPPPAPKKGLAETAGGGLRIAGASENGMFMIAGPAPLQGPLGHFKVWTWFFPRKIQNDGFQDYDTMAIQMEISCTMGTVRPLYFEPYLAGKLGQGVPSNEAATNVSPGSSQHNLWTEACDPLNITGLEELIGGKPLPDHRTAQLAADSWLRILYGNQ